MKTAGYRLELNFLWVPEPEDSINRVARRVSQGGHHIPEDVIRRRHAKGLRNLFKIYRPLLDRWTLYENTDAATRTIAYEEAGNFFVSNLEEFAKVEEIVQSAA